MVTPVKSIKQFFALLSKSKSREFIRVSSGTDVHLIDPAMVVAMSATNTAHELYVYIQGFEMPIRIYGEKDTLKFLTEYVAYLAQFDDL